MNVPQPGGRVVTTTACRLLEVTDLNQFCSEEWHDGMRDNIELVLAPYGKFAGSHYVNPVTMRPIPIVWVGPDEPVRIVLADLTLDAIGKVLRSDELAMTDTVTVHVLESLKTALTVTVTRERMR